MTSGEQSHLVSKVETTRTWSSLPRAIWWANKELSNSLQVGDKGRSGLHQIPGNQLPVFARSERQFAYTIVENCKKQSLDIKQIQKTVATGSRTVKIMVLDQNT
jgi:hypothetical protein